MYDVDEYVRFFFSTEKLFNKSKPIAREHDIARFDEPFVYSRYMGIEYEY